MRTVEQGKDTAPATNQINMEVETMPIVYKVDVLAALKDAGYSSYKIRKEKLLGEATLQKIRNGEPVSWDNIATICRLLKCQPGDILKYE
jgi:putative transcriptional regulator